MIKKTLPLLMILLAGTAYAETVTYTETTIIETPTSEEEIILEDTVRTAPESRAVVEQQKAKPEVVNPNNINFTSGGIGSESRDALHAAEQTHALKVTFAETSGALLSDVQVSIKDQKNTEILNLSTEGPILLVDLKPGTYRLTATLGESVKEKKFTIVSGKKQRFAVHF